MNEPGAGIETICAHLVDAIALLDRLGEDAEAAHVSLSLERLTGKYGLTATSLSTRDPE